MNTKIWNLYKSSEEGQKLIKAFDPLREDLYSALEEIFTFAQNINKETPIEVKWDLFDLVYYNLCLNEEYSRFIQLEYVEREDFRCFINKFEIRALCASDDGKVTLDANKVLIKSDDFRRKASLVDALSLALYFLSGGFMPVLYTHRFDIFQRNCNAVGLELPEIPRTNKYDEYIMYFYDICAAINQFQKEQNLSDAEVCACIYGCAELLLDDENIVSELPRPVNVWFTGADKGDYEQLEKMEEGEHIWACNERTRRGDIVVIYCTSPHSHIHSIWRASSEGIFNPFDYYHCRTLVSDGIKVPKITFNDLKSHPYFSNVPIVRRNLQGLNGIELTSKDYTELLNLIESKGGDISALPKLFEKSADLQVELKIEKDVEEKLLIPLLDKLGYNHGDWTRQASQKAGRNLKAIPDFVFFPKGEEHFQNAPFLIEAKFDMSSIRELKNAFEQATSYSRMMQCKLMGICDKERLILYRVNSSGAWDQSKPIFENHWDVINNDGDVYAQLVKLMAPDVVKTL